MSIKRGIMWARVPKVGSIKAPRIQLEASRRKFRQNDFYGAEGSWITGSELFYTRFVIGFQLESRDIISTFRRHFCRRVVVSTDISCDRIFPLFSSKSISPQYFTISGRTKMDGKIVGYPDRNHEVASVLRLSFRAISATITTYWQ